MLNAVSARLALSVPVLAGAILFGFVLLRVVPVLAGLGKGLRRPGVRRHRALRGLDVGGGAEG